MNEFLFDDEIEQQVNKDLNMATAIVARRPNLEDEDWPHLVGAVLAAIGAYRRKSVPARYREEAASQAASSDTRVQWPKRKKPTEQGVGRDDPASRLDKPDLARPRLVEKPLGPTKVEFDPTKTIEHLRRPRRTSE